MNFDEWAIARFGPGTVIHGGLREAWNAAAECAALIVADADSGRILPANGVYEAIRALSSNAAHEPTATNKQGD